MRVFFLFWNFSHLIKTKKQSSLSLSSAEAEYKAIEAITSEFTWFRYLLQDSQVKILNSGKLYCDNQAALYITANPKFNELSWKLK